MASKKYLVDIDLAKNSLNNARIQNLSSDPSSPVTGQAYYNTVTNRLRVYSGSSWVEMGSAADAGVSTVNGRSGAVVLDKNDVNLSNVDNTSDANKPVSTAQQTAINLKANTSSLATVATTGSYTDLLDKPVATDPSKLIGTTAYLDADPNGATFGPDTISFKTTRTGATGVQFAGEGTLALYANTGEDGNGPWDKYITIGQDNYGIKGVTLATSDVDGYIGLKAPQGLLIDSSESGGTASVTSALVKTTNITAQRTFQLPNASGTIALEGHTHLAADITDFQSAVTSNTAVAANTAARHTHSNQATLDATTASFTTAKDTKLTGIATGATANSTDAVLLARANHTGTQSADTLTDGTTNKAFLATERTKLAGIATGATANSTDATLLARANHTGTQLASTISDFSTAADARISTQKGAVNGIATLGADSKIPTSQIPALALTNVQVAASQAAMLALTTQEGDVVVRTDENKTYMRNAGVTGTMTDFTLLSTPTDVVTSVNGQTGVVVLGKTDVGLGNVDNTSDVNKPVSTAQQTALNLKANLASPTFTGTVSGITKTMVGLGNVDNTSDASKPVSTAQAAADALNLKIASNLSDVNNAATAFSNIKQAASTTATGVVELATDAEATAKASTTVVVTPSNLASFTRKAVGTIGDGTTTAIAVTHGLGSQYVTAQLFDATTNALVECDITLTSATVTTFTFNVAPTTNQYRYVIVG
jgi:hypothetical protein